MDDATVLPLCNENRAWLVLPPLGFYVADLTITLCSQTADYWAGNYAAVQESNPLARVLLEFDPWLFVGFGVLWGISFSLVLAAWNHRGAVVMSILLTLGHAFGISTWLVRHGVLGWAGIVLVLLAAERVTGRLGRFLKTDPAKNIAR